jgi:CDP-paratose 2-epimerase
MKRGHILITGGAGFIGSNLADSLLRDGINVVVFDTLARRGVEANFRWLAERHGSRMRLDRRDIRDGAAIEDAVTGAAAIFHFAAQVAVTSSFLEPQTDFAVNAQGTLNLIEAVRRRAPNTPVIFASTNKVYGSLPDIEIANLAGRDMPVDHTLRTHGVDEDRPLDFSTPYGCSKGVADQYVLDYAKSYGVSTAVLRMSCIYGPRQFGTEDQGWIAHFLIRALAREPITIFGDGRQVRDILHVSDAIAAYRSLLEGIDRSRGKVFNLGGGVANAVSLNLVLGEISRILRRDIEVLHADQRIGDQRYFVADTRRLQTALGWRAKIGWRRGIGDLADWLSRNRIGETVQERSVA